MRHLLYLSILALSLLFIGCNDDDNTPQDCAEGFEGNDCNTEVRAKYLGTWSGPNMCDENALFPIDISMVTLLITESETDILDITLELVLNTEFSDVDIPSETTMLIGNAFETGPSESEVFGFPIIVSSDGIFRSETELSMDFVVTTELPYVGPTTISCSADLEKQ
jgi:hypothetical protein